MTVNLAIWVAERWGAYPPKESERLTRKQRIDPRLTAAGWRIVPLHPGKALAELVITLRDEDRLCIISEEEQTHEPRTMGSMGLTLNASGKPHRLSDRLRSVGDLAARFAEAINKNLKEGAARP